MQQQQQQHQQRQTTTTSRPGHKETCVAGNNIKEEQIAHKLFFQMLLPVVGVEPETDAREALQALYPERQRHLEQNAAELEDVALHGVLAAARRFRRHCCLLDNEMVTNDCISQSVVQSLSTAICHGLGFVQN